MKIQKKVPLIVKIDLLTDYYKRRKGDIILKVFPIQVR